MAGMGTIGGIGLDCGIECLPGLGGRTGLYDALGPVIVAVRAYTQLVIVTQALTKTRLVDKSIH